MRDHVCINSASSSFGNIYFLRYVFNIVASQDTSGDNPVAFRMRMLFNSMNDEKKYKVKYHKSDYM